MGEPVKIKIPLEDDPSGFEAEWVWALPEYEGAYTIDNSPFSAYGISYKDLVSASLINGALEFRCVIAKGGHGTFRVRFPVGASHADFLKYWPALEAAGVTFEGSQVDRPLYSLDVPPTGDREGVERLLGQLETAGVWEYERAD